MEPSKVAWGIEVGEFALKAIRLAMVGNEIHVTDFAVIPHQKVLSDPSVSDREGMIRVTLGAFVQTHAEQIASEPIIMSLPGNVGFARFATIPAVDAKTLRSMIEYEAKQQIPFPIEEVEWDSHILPADDSGQLAIGIFAVTKERLHELLKLYAECGIEPDVLTLSSVAVYNALHFDLELENKPEPISCMDIGTNSSDLIVIANGKFWIRTFPIGGSQFTSAIADAFASQNVNYSRAEKIKLDRAPSEKILRARTMAMRRVTGQLVDEIGRSREFYHSANEGVNLNRAFGVGSTLKISGLRTKIAGDLQMTVDRLEEFKRIHLNGPDAADFAAHSINLLTAFGLGLQGLGLAKVELNLSPMAQIRQKIWKSKTPWFVAAAALFVATSVAFFLRYALDQIELSKMSTTVARAENTIKQGKSLVEQLNQSQQSSGQVNVERNNLMNILKDRNVWSFLVSDTYQALASSNPDKSELGSSPERILQIPAGDRRLVQLEEFSGSPSIDAATGLHKISVSVRVILTNKDPTRFINDANGVLDWLRTHSDRPEAPYTIDAKNLNIPKWVTVLDGKRSESLVSSDSATSVSENMSESPAESAPKGSGGSAIRKKDTGGPIQDSGGGFRGGLVSGDDTSSSSQNADGTDGGVEGGKTSNARSKSKIKARPDEKLIAIDLNKEAPLPSAPNLILPGEKQFEGILTFTVTLKSPIPVVEPASESQ